MATIKPCGACGISGIHACLGAPIATNDLLLIQTLSKRIAQLEQALKVAGISIESIKDTL